jgi:hypothetical protein
MIDEVTKCINTYAAIELQNQRINGLIISVTLVFVGYDHSYIGRFSIIYQR